MSAFVALREKGVPVELVPVNLQRADHLAPEYAALSTTNRVPTLSDGGFNLSESSAICEYIEDHFAGPALYPAGAQAKAKAREVQAWLRSDLLAIREERSTEFVFLKRQASALSSAAQAAARKLFRAADALLPAGQEALFGAWSVADTDLALMLNRLVLAGDAVPERLARYAGAQWQRPSVQEWVCLQRPVQ